MGRKSSKPFVGMDVHEDSIDIALAVGGSVVPTWEACRVVQPIHAVRIVAGLGDLSRFDHPRQRMAYLGLIRSEASSGERCHQGAITKAGNGSFRRALVEAAWAYRYRAKVMSRTLSLSSSKEADSGERWEKRDKPEHCDEQEKVTESVHAVGAAGIIGSRCFVHCNDQRCDQPGGQISGCDEG